RRAPGREADGRRQMGWKTEATALEKAADPSDRDAQGDGGRDGVERTEHGKAEKPQQRRIDEDERDQAAGRPRAGAMQESIEGDAVLEQPLGLGARPGRRP